MHVEHVANALGALALTVADLVTAAATGAARTSTSGATALAVLLQAGGLGITELGRRIGLSQPAAARMVDTLESADLVRRHRGPGRQTTVVLTRAGTASAHVVLRERGTLLTRLLEGLTVAERATLADLIDRILIAAHAEVGSADLICRLCDRPSCVAKGQRCPVGGASRRQPDA
jgi:MarR family transcriptional repressor of emrRAB